MAQVEDPMIFTTQIPKTHGRGADAQSTVAGAREECEILADSPERAKRARQMWRDTR
jgi:hypothetical protein